MTRRADITALEAAVRTLIEDATAGGHGLLVIPTGAVDLIYRTRPGVAGGIPAELIRADDVAEALADVERLLAEPDWMRWPDVEFAEDAA